MGGQVLDGLLVLAFLKDQTGTHKRQVQNHIDLVEGKPVLHQALVAGEDRDREVLVEVDELAVAPAAILLDEVNRAVEVRDGHERLDAVRLTLAEHVLVEGQAGLVGLGLVTVGEDAGPRQAHTEGLKAHLGKEGDVLLVVVIEIDAGLRGIVIAVLEVEHLALAGDHRIALGAVRSHVHVGKAAAVHVVGALALVGSRCAAPQEVITESHVSTPSHAVVIGSVSLQTTRRSTATARADTSFRTRWPSSRPRLTLSDTAAPNHHKGDRHLCGGVGRFVSICNS